MVPANSSQAADAADEIVTAGDPTIPVIPADAREDPEPGDGVETLPAGDDPDKAHWRWMESIRLTFAVWVVIVSVVVVVGLTITQFVTQDLLTDSSSLSSTISWLQGLAGTAAGFALGRAAGEAKSKSKD